MTDPLTPERIISEIERLAALYESRAECYLKGYSNERTTEHGRLTAIGATRLQELSAPQPIGELVAGLIKGNQ